MGVVDEKDVVVVSALLGEELEKVGGGCGVAAVEWKRLVCGDRVGWGVGLEKVGGEGGCGVDPLVARGPMVVVGGRD